MKMKNKIMMTGLCALALLSGLASCGKENASASAAPSVSESVAPAPTGAIQIEFWHTSGQGIVTEYERAARDFAALVKENEGVDIVITPKYQGNYTDIESKVSSGFSTGNYPTIAIAYPDHVATYLAKEKSDEQYVINLEKLANDPEIGFGKEAYIGDGEASDFVKAFYDEGKEYAKEGIYSLPLMKSTEVMFYNKTLTDIIVPMYNDEKGLGMDTYQMSHYFDDISWDAFIDFAEYVKDKIKAGAFAGKQGNKLEIPVFYDSDSNLFITKSYQNDIPFVSIKDGAGSNDFNNDKAKAMVKKLKKNSDDGILTTKGVKNIYGSDLFTQEKVLFDIGSSGGADYNSPQGGGFTIGVCKVPYDNNKPSYVTQGLTTTLLRTPDDTDGLKYKYGWKFLKYLTSTEVNLDLALYGSAGYVPVRESCYETDYFKEWVADAEFLGDVQKIVREKINGHYLNTACFSGSSKSREAVGGIIAQAFSNTKAKTEKEIDKLIDDLFAEAKNNADLAKKV
jgi:multiple sugar transport system substrate-binding protein